MSGDESLSRSTADGTHPRPMGAETLETLRSTIQQRTNIYTRTVCVRQKTRRRRMGEHNPPFPAPIPPLATREKKLALRRIRRGRIVAGGVVTIALSGVLPPPPPDRAPTHSRLTAASSSSQLQNPLAAVRHGAREPLYPRSHRVAIPALTVWL